MKRRQKSLKVNEIKLSKEDMKKAWNLYLECGGNSTCYLMRKMKLSHNYAQKLQEHVQNMKMLNDKI